MPDGFFDGIGNWLGISYTTAERKRDEYNNLRNALSDKLAKLNKYYQTIDQVKFALYGVAQAQPEDVLGAVWDSVCVERYDSLLRDLKCDIDSMNAAIATANQKYSYYYWLAEEENRAKQINL